MIDYDFVKDSSIRLQEKLVMLIELHQQKCKLYKNATESKNFEMAKRLYDESKIIWKSIEKIKRELPEYQSRYLN